MCVCVCVCVCLYVEQVSRSKDCVQFGMKIDSVIRPETPVSPSVPEMEWGGGGPPFLGCGVGGVYVHCLYLHAR